MCLFKGAVRLISTAIVILLIGCGGGGVSSDTGSNNSNQNNGSGGGGSVSDNTYNGKTENAELDLLNANSMLVSAIETIDLAEEIASMIYGDESYRYYLGTSAEELAEAESFADENVSCTSGSMEVVDDTNAEGIGELSINFNNCGLAGDTIDGEILLEVEAVSSEQIRFILELNDFALRSDSENLDLTIDAILEQNYGAPGEFNQDPFWVAEILITYLGRGYEVYAPNLTRTSNFWQYRVEGDFFHSEYGKTTLEFVNQDPDNLTLYISGSNSSIEAITSAGSNGALTVSDYTVSVDVDGDEGFDYSLAASVTDLMNFYGDSGEIPEILISSVESADRGQTISLEANLADPTSYFYTTNWTVAALSGICEPDILDSDRTSAQITSDCTSTIEVEYQIDNGVNVSSKVVQIDFLKLLPSVQFEFIPVNSTEGVPIEFSYSVNSEVEDGPFEQQLVISPKNAELSIEDASISWAGDLDVPMAQNPMDIAFTLMTSNGRNSYESAFIEVEIASYMPPLELNVYPTAEPYLYYSAIDLDPNQVDADIAMVGANYPSGNTNQHILKFNKLTETTQKIFNLPAVKLDWDNETNTDWDWNGDGIKDFVWSDADSVLIYDLKNELVIAEFDLWVMPVSSCSGNQITSVTPLPDNTSENVDMVFLVEGSGCEPERGIYRFQEHSSSPELLVDFSYIENLGQNEDSEGAIVWAIDLEVTNLDSDADVELLLVSKKQSTSANLEGSNTETLMLFDFESGAYRYVAGTSFTADEDGDIDDAFGFYNIFIEDILGDSTPEIVLLTSNNCSEDSYGATAYLLDPNLDLIETQRSRYLVGRINGESSFGQNIYTYVSSCEEPDEGSKFALFDWRLAKPRWKVDDTEPYNQSIPHTVVDFRDDEGNLRLIKANTETLFVTQ